LLPAYTAAAVCLQGTERHAFRSVRSLATF